MGVNNLWRRIGASNLLVNPIGVGCWSFGGGEYWGEQSQKEDSDIVAYALDRGLNLFDTAEMYNNGKSEESLGIALKGKRNKAIICTKFSPANAYPAMLKKSCEASLKRLNTDYIDLYILHWPINAKSVEHFTKDPDTIGGLPDISETFATLKTLQDEGKIREIGVSNHGVKQLSEIIKTNIKIAANELTYNIFSRAIEHDIVGFCESKNIGIIGSMALMQGILAGIYEEAADVPYNQAHSSHYHHSRGKGTSRHGGEGCEEEMFEALGKLRGIASSLGMGLAQLSVAWVLAKKFICCSLIGSRSIGQLEENIKALEAPLSPQTVQQIDKISLPVWQKMGNNPDYYESDENTRIY